VKAWSAAQQKEVTAFLDAHPGPYVWGPDEATHQGTWTIVTLKNSDKAIAIPALEDSGGKPCKYVTITEPRHGKAALEEYPNVKYTPNADYVGIDDFMIAAKDAEGRQSNPVWVAVEVNSAVVAAQTAKR
jgi:hypothetical protein